MKWLARIFIGAFRWIALNPVVVVLVAVVLTFNHFTAVNEFRFTPAALLRGDALWSTVHSAIASATHLKVAAYIALGNTAAALITIFETGAMFAIFRDGKRLVSTGVSYLFSARLVTYFVYQSLLLSSATALLVAAVFVVTMILGLRGASGAFVIAFIAALGYALLYLLLVVGATILSTSADLTDRLHYFRVALSGSNFRRLAGYYLIRIGGEALVAYAGLALVGYLRLPALMSAIVVLLAVAAPFALIRTAGFILKLEIFSDEPWFRDFFQNYYREHPEIAARRP